MREHNFESVFLHARRETIVPSLADLRSMGPADPMDRGPTRKVRDSVRRTLHEGTSSDLPGVRAHPSAQSPALSRPHFADRLMSGAAIRSAKNPPMSTERDTS